MQTTTIFTILWKLKNPKAGDTEWKRYAANPRTEDEARAIIAKNNPAIYSFRLLKDTITTKELSVK